MGLFGFFKKKKKAVDENLDAQKAEDFKVDTSLETVNYTGTAKNSGTDYIRSSCDQIMEASVQLEESKVEYEAVTSYLNDIHKIDSVPFEDKEILLEAAEKIGKLTKERSKYQDAKNIKITNSQMKHMEQYESEIPAEIKKIQGYEAYNSVIKSDMRHLEGEKGALLYRKEEIIYQQNYLKKLAIITFSLVLTLFALFFVISSLLKNNMTLPFLLTIFMAVVSSLYIFYEARKNQREVKVVENKLLRAVGLLNKVKIKYVNNTSCLDYAYSKYMVNSAVELMFLWDQYIRAKEEERRYKKNTELLHHFNEILIEEMKNFKLADPDIWIYQTEALVDNKEMVEIRHRLNVRRQKLREQIDYNIKAKESGINAVKNMLEKNPDLKEDIVGILKDYNINI